MIFGGSWGGQVRRGTAGTSDFSGTAFFTIDLPGGAIVLSWPVGKNGSRSRSAPSEAAILAAHPGHGDSRWSFAEKDATEWAAAFNEERDTAERDARNAEATS